MYHSAKQFIWNDKSYITLKNLYYTILFYCSNIACHQNYNNTQDFYYYYPVFSILPSNSFTFPNVKLIVFNSKSKYEQLKYKILLLFLAFFFKVLPLLQIN
jgi:hypothetical protein